MTVPTVCSEKSVYQELSDLVGNQKKVMVYGFTHCGWGDLRSTLPKMGYQVLDYCMDEDRFTFNYREENSFYLGPLTKLVLENYLKTCQGKAPIPCLFSIDSNDNPYPRINVIHPSKDEVNLHTLRELKRVYQLCFDPEIDPRIQAMARKSFIFLRVGQNAYRNSEIEKRVYGYKEKDYISDQVPEYQRVYIKRIVRVSQTNPPWPNYWDSKQEKAYISICRFVSSVFSKSDREASSTDWKDQVNAACALLNGEKYEKRRRSRL